MRRFATALSILAIGVGIGACGGDDDGGNGGGDDGPNVGFIYVSPLEGSAWTQAWDDARQSLEEELGAQTEIVEPIPENSDVVPVMENLIREGNEVIFATAFGYQPFVEQVARQNPDVSFVVIGPWAQKEDPPENVASVYANLWEARYATGVLAGLTTESDQLGFVSAFSIPSVVAGINGFQRGVESVNPQAETRVVLTNNWYDPPRASQAAQSLAGRGADVIAKHEDSIGPLLGAEEAGVWGIGSEADTSEQTPDTYLTGTVYDWRDYSVEKVQEHLDGSFEGDETNGDLKSGLVTLGPMHPDVPDDVRRQVEEVVDELESGELVVFEGPLKDNRGNTVLGSGEEWVSPADVYANMTFFVDGVIGTVQE
jgi:basic membrane lipoprotein Med (substrate-binding protein (PBP1-ABC) superfamily)